MELAMFILVLVAVPLAGFSALWRQMVSTPMNQRERTRFFLDLLETMLDRGQSVERGIVSSAESRDETMGVDFFLLAAHLENGLRLGEALGKVPSYLPPVISAILQAGEKLGDLKKVLPACREHLKSPPDYIRSAVEYMGTVLMVFAPVCIGLVWGIWMFVLPKFNDMVDATGVPVWSISRFAFEAMPWICGVECVFWIMAVILLQMYAKPPKGIYWLRFHRLPIVDWIAWCIPWKRKRFQRTFSAMLAVLLDGGVPEIEAVRLAGDCTVNHICQNRAARVIAALAIGVKLDEAVRLFDNSGEYHWRLTNATHGRNGFLTALHGWHESLDAKAMQQENLAVQATMSGLVIANGLFVGLIAIGMFGVLIAILHGAADTW